MGELRKKVWGIFSQAPACEVLELGKSSLRKTQTLEGTPVHTLTSEMSAPILYPWPLQAPPRVILHAPIISAHPAHAIEIIHLLNSLQITYFQ